MNGTLRIYSLSGLGVEGFPISAVTATTFIRQFLPDRVTSAAIGYPVARTWRGLNGSNEQVDVRIDAEMAARPRIDR